MWWKCSTHRLDEFQSLHYSQSLSRHRPVICSSCTIQLTILNKESGKPWYQHPHISIKLVSIWTHVSYPPNSVENFVLLIGPHLLQECPQHNLAIALVTIALFCVIGVERVAIFSDRHNELVLSVASS